MLKRLKIHRFRHVAPGTELEFSDRYNVLLGKNGTGKTTLLDLISMVLRSNFSSLRGEEFDIEWQYVQDEDSVHVRFLNEVKARRPGRGVNMAPAHSYHPHVKLTFNLPQLGKHHQFEIEIDGTSLRFRERGEGWRDGSAVDVFGASLFKTSYFAMPMTDNDDSALSSVSDVGLRLFMAGVDTYRFDESLDVYHRMTADEPFHLGNSFSPPSIHSQWQSNTPLSPQILVFYPIRHVPETPKPGQSTTRVTLSFDGSLTKFVDLAPFQNMAMSLAVEGSAEEDGITTWLLGRSEFLFTTSAGTTFNHHALSYGQKRLLAFLYYLDVNQHHVVADELVNGMHHDWIKACLELMGTRQAFLTSQNPLLLDYLPLESVEQVQRSFIQCTVRTSKKKSEFVWSNLDVEDAKQLLADYDVGIQHVGELLRVRGLW